MSPRRSLSALLTALALVAGCAKDSSPGAPEPSGSAAPSASVGPAASASASASASPEEEPPQAPLSDLPEITAKCCTRDRAEGHFGPESGVHTAFVGDFLRKKDGGRLLFPDDLISDTKELFQHARSAGKTVKQERKLRIVGETERAVSVEVFDTGETGSMKPFSHSSCKTISLRDGRLWKLEDAVGKDHALAVAVKARIQFDQRNKGDLYRFVEKSFALVDEGKRIRFCNPRKDEALGAARLDVDLPVPK